MRMHHHPLSIVDFVDLGPYIIILYIFFYFAAGLTTVVVLATVAPGFPKSEPDIDPNAAAPSGVDPTADIVSPALFINCV